MELANVIALPLDRFIRAIGLLSGVLVVCAIVPGLAGCASPAAGAARGVDAPAIEWDRGTLRRVSSATAREPYNGYARMVQLPDRSLRCVYEASGRIVMVSSLDVGDTWSEPIVVADQEPRLCMTVPDILVLNDGTLLASYNPRPCPPGDGRRFEIRTRRSIDGGATWGDERVVFTAGGSWSEGCWEPAAIQLPDGGLRLFFANEAPYTESGEQNISMARSADGGLTWSAPEIVSFRARCRDGMPSPLWLDGQQRILVAIEDTGFGAPQPYIVRSQPGGEFPHPIDGDSPDRHAALAGALPPELHAGAPCLRRLSTGETILSYQGTEGRRNESHHFAAMRVVVGDREARHFGGTTVPFEIPADSAGIWNSLAILDDDTIVAITSTSAYTPGEVEIWMVKGRLARR